MARASKFTAADRRAAVERAFEGTESPTAVASDLGVHPTTLYRWAASDTTDDPGPAPTRLVHATQTLLEHSDYGDITVEAVAQHCGLAARTAFHHFPTKRDLFHAAVNDAATTLIDRMATRSEQATWPDDPLGQLRSFLHIAAATIYDTPATHVLFRNIGVPRSEGTAEGWHTDFVVAIEQLLHRAADAGQIERHTDVAAAAQLVTGAMRGIHTAVFDGASPDVALDLVDRVPLLIPGPRRT
ncbi:TetR family transcriptional regulator [Rhodococcus sp. BP-149]|jgi:AcrR family transcriptional regulator|uniref:TetR family transcriptional regulator n=1 Tax=unclassified Rhodococcus (in: high G+C Gram-positive bacteria) TaxID=192944 RepID=UPI001C9A6EC4|nr:MULTISPECIES: TetR family transcriptional regulator [unclassified Rhodococcus (in: high G+C Gram-positive bacteria)]MBY6685532.1 TetR family transcriptional regulator [Rhodococcus sp. BP-288]MBY6694903.1 TetR family transcriptional regulator [Rhodococcus sp. BP-188]MBY6696766.1 TetR family transcriptional regulator [Rhodococcus sp. BP-285]MBY6703422.1 TetR family transcriptional regulator [Rhodococcus sp. BP-283]MBY6710624.1 TetR family transcriptional regulator [Rhodococcus sp. BP-160]